jgi:hypothetical protein
MRLCHATSKGLDLPPRRSQRSVTADRTGCHPHTMNAQRPSRAGGFTEEAPHTTWPWQGTEDFLGLNRARGRVSSPRGEASVP